MSSAVTDEGFFGANGGWGWVGKGSAVPIGKVEMIVHLSRVWAFFFNYFCGTRETKEANERPLWMCARTPTQEAEGL